MLTFRTIGRYRITRRLGRGGFAAVWLAEDPLLDARVAVKVLADNYSDDEDIRARFIQEARLLRRLRSAHVVTVYDFGETDTGQPYFVMEYAVRGTLAARFEALRQAGVQPSAEDVRTVIAALGDGLHALHEDGIVHRDVKPGNLLLRASAPLEGEVRAVVLPDETIMLGDLGLAKVMNDGTRQLTMGGGTLGYAAPEQLEPNARVDQRADVFGASAVLAEIMTGAAPTIGAMPDLSSVGDEMGTVLARGLSRDPTDRHRRITDWATEATSALAPTRRDTPGADAAPPRPPTVRYIPEATEVVQGDQTRHVKGPPPPPRPRAGSQPAEPSWPPDPPWQPERTPPPDPPWQPEQPPAQRSGPPPRRSPVERPGPPERRARGTAHWWVLAALAAVIVFVWAARTIGFGGGSAIVGPDTLVVGQAGAFVADPLDAGTATWTVDPPDTPAVQRGDDLIITPDGPGDVRVVLEVEEPDGTVRTGQRGVNVVANTSGLAIEGPARAIVGQDTTYTAAGTDSGDAALWRTPQGDEVRAPQLTIRGDEVGPVTLELIDERAGGRSVSRTITVVAERGR